MSEEFDVLIGGGHVIDPRKNIDATGLYVTPGLLDIHLYAYGRFHAWLYPDQHCLPYGVTTCVDTGSSGWQHFPDFVETVIDTETSRGHPPSRIGPHQCRRRGGRARIAGGHKVECRMTLRAGDYKRV